MLIDKLGDVWNSIIRNFSTIRFADIIDIAVVAILLYYVFKFIRDRRAGKLAVGIITLLLILAVSNLFDMRVMQYLLHNVFQIGIIAIIIVFQPEFRAVLEKVGGGSLRSVRSFGDLKGSEDYTEMVDSVVQAATELSETKTGALIVFERTTRLGDLVLTGTELDSVVSVSLIKNIFFKNSPLHDGAVIIRNNRLHAAGCLLPLSSSQDITKDLGTRHRAALGMSENSDAVVLVVSEETGIISIASEGKITRGYNKEKLTEILTKMFEPQTRNRTIRSKIEYFRSTRSLKNAVDKKKPENEDALDNKNDR